MSAVERVWLAAALALTVSATPLAQESKSAALAKELSAALDAAKLDSIAAKDPAKPDVPVFRDPLRRRLELELRQIGEGGDDGCLGRHSAEEQR